MKLLELMHSLEEAYERFGEIDVNIECNTDSPLITDKYPIIKELIIDSDKFTIKCE